MRKYLEKLESKFYNWIIKFAVDWDIEDNKRWDI